MTLKEQNKLKVMDLITTHQGDFLAAAEHAVTEAENAEAAALAAQNNMPHNNNNNNNNNMPHNHGGP